MIQKEGLTPGGQRKKLSAVLPLDTPFVIQMFPSYACNFRCNFCLHALDRQQHGNISDVDFMDMAAYRKYIDDMKTFPQKLKMLRFAAIGEPLLHKNIADMIAYAKQADIAYSIDIVTNGSLLTEELSNRLIQAGLDRLRISVNGLSSEDFQQNTCAKVDFERYVKQIEYFFKHSGHTHVYIKIIDYMVQSDQRKQKFFDIFRPICHSIAVEHLTPTIAEIDYGALSKGMAMEQTQNGGALIRADVCPQPFYMMQINADGKVVPCCSTKYPVILGDANIQAVPDIWRGASFNQFRLNMLQTRERASSVCGQCDLYLYDLHEEDVLDTVKDQLVPGYSNTRDTST